MTQRFLIPSYGPDETTLKQAFRLCIDISDSMNIILHVPTMAYLDLGGVLYNVLGKPACKQLKDGILVKLSSTRTVKLVTDKTFGLGNITDIILSIYPSKAGLNLIDRQINAFGIIVLPWSDDEYIQQWIRTWEPSIPGQGPSENRALVDDPLIEELLKMLTNTVNLSTGLVDSRDKAATIELFRYMRDGGIQYEPDDLRAWAIRNQWTPSGADQLRDVAEAVLQGKKLRTMKDYKHWRSDIIETVRQRISK